MIFLLPILILSPLITYIIHILFIRYMKNMPYQVGALISVIIGNIPMLFISIIFTLKIPLTGLEKIVTIIYSLTVYNILAYIYFHIFNMSETARRIYILITLKKYGQLNREDIFAQYNADDVVDIRLKRLLNMKQLKEEEGLYKINRHLLLFIAKLYDIWVRMLGCKVV